MNLAEKTNCLNILAVYLSCFIVSCFIVMKIESDQLVCKPLLLGATTKASTHQQVVQAQV